MANYTIELRELVEKYHFPLALNDYPIFDESYRPLLNRKIIEHFISEKSEWKHRIDLISI